MDVFELKQPGTNNRFQIKARDAAHAQEILDSFISPPSAAEVGTDMGKSAVRGLGDFAVGVPGLPGDIQNLAELGASKIGGIPREKMREDLRGLSDVSDATVPSVQFGRMPSSADLQRKVEQWTGPWYDPKTREGRYTRNIASFVPGGVLGAARQLPGRLLRLGAAPGLASEYAGEKLEGSPWEAPGRVGAALVAPFALGRAIMPLPIPKTRQDYLDALDAEGVGKHLTAGQRTGRKSLMYTETLGDLPFAGGKFSEQGAKQKEAFVGAAMRRIDQEGNPATPEFTEAGRKNAGAMMEEGAKRGWINFNQQFHDDILDWKQRLLKEGLPNDVTQRIDQQARNIAQGFQQGKAGETAWMPGKTYQSLTEHDSALQALINEGGRPGHYAKQLRDILEDARRRTAHGRGTREGAGVRQAYYDTDEGRRMYKDALAIQEAALRGEGGTFSPAQLKGALVGQNRTGFARGRGDMRDLAEAGDVVMKPLPDSGTAWRGYAMSLPASLGMMAGGGATGTHGLTLASLLAAAGPPATGRALMSGPVQGWLGNSGPAWLQQTRSVLGAPTSDRERLARILTRLEATAPVRQLAE